jgi:hypothetical protein
MATSAISSHGTLLKIGDGDGSEVYTTIAEVLDISGPSYEVSNRRRRRITTAPGGRSSSRPSSTAGRVSFDINYYSASDAGSRWRPTCWRRRNGNLPARLPAAGVSGTDTRAILGIHHQCRVFRRRWKGCSKCRCTLKITGAGVQDHRLVTAFSADGGVHWRPISRGSDARRSRDQRSRLLRMSKREWGGDRRVMCAACLANGCVAMRHHQSGWQKAILIDVLKVDRDWPR